MSTERPRVGPVSYREAGPNIWRNEHRLSARHPRRLMVRRHVLQSATIPIITVAGFTIARLAADDGFTSVSLAEVQ